MVNSAFFRFLLGFIVIIALGLVGVIVAEAYSGNNMTVQDLIANFFR